MRDTVPDTGAGHEKFLANPRLSFFVDGHPHRAAARGRQFDVHRTRPKRHEQQSSDECDTDQQWPVPEKFAHEALATPAP
jgi:hypothetical protein